MQTYSQPLVAADPTVRRVCSQAVMLASRQGQARLLPAADWEIQVLPPSEAAFDSGARAYRCLATQIGHQPTASQFGGYGRTAAHRHSSKLVPTAFGM